MNQARVASVLFHLEGDASKSFVRANLGQKRTPQKNRRNKVLFFVDFWGKI